MTNTRFFPTLVVVMSIVASMPATAQMFGGSPELRQPRIPMPHEYRFGPQGHAFGHAARGVGVNREGQVAAACVGQFGVTHAGAACVAGRLTVDELNKCFSDGIGGRGCFGDNNTLVRLIRSNMQAAQRESNPTNAAIRATTGVSVGDIKKHGLAGGPNSEVRKIGRLLRF